MKSVVIALCGLLLSGLALASGGEVIAEGGQETLVLTSHWVGVVSLIVFVLAYIFVVLEEQLHLRKSKPVLVAAGIIWILIAWAYAQGGYDHAAEEAIRHNFLEYAELFFFLLVAMTYINAMLERGVFDQLRIILVAWGFSYRALFWITGVLAFFISPLADNLTTALIMCAVVLAVGKDKPTFVAMACINIVVGANAGGAFSPFGDITTLMVWQKGMVTFAEFFSLFLPSVVNFVVPAAIMHFFLPSGKPLSVGDSGKKVIKPGGLVMVVLFLLTIVTAVSFHNYLHLPPVYGMMLGLAFLKIFGYILRLQSKSLAKDVSNDADILSSTDHESFDVFQRIAHAEWDTLFFFYGVIMAVGGLGFIGYLAVTAEFFYVDLGPMTANILVGVMSAIVDNIPVMFAVLTMNPEMSHAHWLLVTLTAGVGGSLLSVGSAAGVALMGQARGQYTFFSHLKWTPAIALGYVASIWVHYLIQGAEAFY